ncbi:MAG TPA: hypothetical protein VND64_00985 [Pirellulales bacterium]|nr:hypothetical protein [Pirellulales bacterium]
MNRRIWEHLLRGPRLKGRDAFGAISLALIMGVALFEPHFFSGPMLPNGPHVWLGDEPHYLVMVNSLLNDGDLELSNNYAAANAGALDAGRRFAGRPLDHHTKWYVGERFIAWYEYFETNSAGWRRDRDGHPAPKPRHGCPAEWAPRREYSWHPPGLACVLSALLWPLRGSDLVEPMALVCSGASLFAAACCFWRIVKPYAAGANAAWIVMAAAFLATPAWHYGRTLFTEPYLLACATGAYAAAFRRRSFLLAGCLIAVGVSMKPPLALLALPLAAGALVRGRIVSAMGAILPSCAAVAALAALNYHMHGSWTRSPIQWISGDFVEGATGLFFSWAHGLVPIAPLVVVALACWPTFLRLHPYEGWQVAGAFLLYFCLMSAWVDWEGGLCYGPRMMVPVIPFLCVPLATAPRCVWWRFAPVRFVALELCLLSLAINGYAAIANASVWGRNPLDFIIGWS